MARRFLVATVLLIAALSCAPWSARACSTFCLNGDDGPVFGKNYDWDFPDGLVVVNKRNVEKTGLTADNPASWTSRYGSVTFNQYGREMPCGGINEVGLVIELMWLDETEYPPADSRPTLQNLQWIQYHLDRSSTVAEVIAGDENVRIAGGGEVSIHFLVADRSGACAAIEFLGGEMTARTGDSMPVAVLTNDTYDRSVAFLESHEGFGGSSPVPSSRSSLDRFVRLAAAAAEYESDAGAGAVDYAFGVLSFVSQGEYTQWSIVYDVADLRVNFRTRDHREIRTIDLRRLDFGCGSPVLIMDVNAGLAGDVTERLEPYSIEANRALVESAFTKTSFLADTPEWIRDQLVRYPESTRCSE
jgi:penicillin V acylase-like amidase (Ntn superfamily)